MRLGLAELTSFNLAKVLHHGRQLGVSARPVAGQLNNKFRRTHALLLFVFDILFLGAFRYLFSCVIRQGKFPPRALPENVYHSLGEITLKRRGRQGQQAARTNRAR